MMVLMGQLIQNRDVMRKRPILKAIEVSDLGRVRTKNDCSEVRAGTSVDSQVLKKRGSDRAEHYVLFYLISSSL